MQKVSLTNNICISENFLNPTSIATFKKIKEKCFFNQFLDQCRLKDLRKSLEIAKLNKEVNEMRSTIENFKLLEQKMQEKDAEIAELKHSIKNYNTKIDQIV